MKMKPEGSKHCRYSALSVLSVSINVDCTFRKATNAHQIMSNAQINRKHCTAGLHMDLNLLNNASKAECNYALLVPVNTLCSYMYNAKRPLRQIKWAAFIPAHSIPTGSRNRH